MSKLMFEIQTKVMVIMNYNPKKQTSPEDIELNSTPFNTYYDIMLDYSYNHAFIVNFKYVYGALNAHFSIIIQLNFVVRLKKKNITTYNRQENWSKIKST